MNIQTALDSFLARTGKTHADFRTKSKLGSILNKGGVANTSELKRILELPSYRWQDDPDLPAISEYIEGLFAKSPHWGCRPRCGHEFHTENCPECVRASAACVCRGKGVMHLRPVQVAALQAIHDFQGMMGPIRVGGGKTLISYLAGAVLGKDRTLLLIPAKLQKKTLRDFALLKRHWVGPQRMHIISYELLARDRGLTELHKFNPDLIIADEAHKLKNKQAACTKRLRRYLVEENPNCAYVDMSGNITKRSILEYYHRQNWAIPDGLQALPRKYHEARDWADALDENSTRIFGRLMPGALFQFCTDSEIKEAATDQRKTTATRIARQAYGRRFLSAPGVVGTEEQFDGAMPILIQSVDFRPGPAIVEAFARLRTDWSLPDGHPIDMASDLWRHARELAQGFYYKWYPPPPTDWLMARKTWSATVREILKNYRDIDSPLGVVRAVDSGRIAWARESLANWRDIKDFFKPNTVPEWLDTSMLKFAAKWAQQNRGIIWVEHVAFGRRLSEETRLPYYGAKGLCRGKMIEEETETCIASVAANSEGRNLQHFSKNLVISCPPGGAIWEQMIGRTHRDGQMADEVLFDLPMCCFEHWDVFRKALRDAEYIERTTKQNQKLNFADITVPTEQEVQEWHNSGDPLWNKCNAMFFENDSDYTAIEKHMAGLTPSKREEFRKRFSA